MTDTVEPITREEREEILQRFWDRYYGNRQVCSLPQNYCRNNHLMDEAGLRLAELQAALRASEERIKKLEEALDWFCVQSEVWLDGRVETAKPGWMKVAIARARQALGE